MRINKDDILKILKGNKCINRFKNVEINAVILFGSTLTEDFTEDSDIDIAILSKEDIGLHTILGLEEYLKKLLGREIDIINLRDKNIDLNMKVTIYDDGLVIYDDESNLYSIDYAETERLYKDNETFRFFRERDVIFNE